MRVALIGKKYIVKETLPRNIIDNYWLTDKTQQFNNKLINIKIHHGKYEMVNSEYSKILDFKYLEVINNNLSVSQQIGNTLQSVVLEENYMYPILMNNSKEIYILYCLPDFEDSFNHLDIIGTQEITIGSNDNNSIVYKSPLVAGLHAKICKFNGKWTIENYDSKYGAFVNNFPVYNNTKNIFNGDIIFIMGLEIVIIKDTIYINNPQNNVVFDKNYFKLSNIEKTLIDKKNTMVKGYKKLDINNNIDYYSRSPRMIPPIKIEKLKIDEPPELIDEQQRPILLTLGSSIAMGIMMLASLTTTIQGMASGTASVIEIVMGFVTAIAMLIAMLVFPILDVKWDRKSNKKYEQKRQRKYKQYLERKTDLINEIKNNQRMILYKNYLAVDECATIISQKNPRLWEREIEDDDFLAVRIGVGKVPLKIDISYPQEKFAMVDDNLVTALNDIIKESETIEDCPVIVSLANNTVSAIVSTGEEFTRKYIKNIILQLVTFHSYEDLKLVFLIDKKNSKEWEYVKMLPHLWDDSKQVRFFADNYDDMNELSKYLTEELTNRLEGENKDKNYKAFSPYYLIITDNYKLIDSLSFITEFLKSKKNAGFSLLCITDDVYSLPSSCRTFIDIRGNPKGVLYENGIEQIHQTEIRIEPLYTIFFEKMAQKLANIPIKESKGTTSLPNNYSFLEMYDVGNIEQLDIIGRWKKNDSTLSLKAPVGIDSNGMIISLDAHEKFHGPHGIIAGSTGSGKSEFIITYILSLAINYHPDDLTFLLIDYKGGGLAGAFQKHNIKLPHLVGTITNIDKHGLERSLISIQSELRKREIIFNEARNVTNEGTIDIYKYQKLYHDGVVKEPVSHLFIICDEFAELKQQQQDFMDELVSVSRIGRSLGVHLILATQKPSGIVDDQIRGNSRFGICLKVQDTADSQDVILRPDAAFLKNPGQFYLKVGHNEYFVLGQSGWAGAPYISSDVPVKKIDSSVEFISNIGFPIKKINETKTQNYKNNGEQLTNILNYICDVAKQEGISTNNLWLDNIPADIYVKNLRDKYNVKPKNDVQIIIGEYDDPSNQRQGLVELNFSKRDNIIIYGNAESGKETLLSTITYDLMTTYSVEQAQIYILDFGTEALKIYKNSPHVGDIIFMGQDEKLVTFFDMIQRIIKERKQILSNYNGDYNLYIEKENEMPIIAIILNNYEAFNENYEEKFDDIFLTLTREGAKCGIIFIVTASSTSSMRYRLTSNFNKKIALMLNDEDDYYSIFDNVRNKRPTHMFGRGLVLIENDIFEFQTAKISKNTNYNEHIEETIDMLNKKSKTKADPVPTLPKKIELQDVSNYMNGLSKVPIGLVKKNLDIYTYDFIKNFMTVISAKNMADAVELSKYIFEEIKDLEGVKVDILDAEDAKGKKKKAYNDFVKSIKNDMKKGNTTFTICVIIGIDKFTSEEIIDEYEFSELLAKAKENGKHCFIIIENPDRLEEHTYDDWYTNFINQDCGIWIGNGVENQTLINSNFSMEGLENNCGNSYGYVIDEGIPTLVKFIGIEEDDENE